MEVQSIGQIFGKENFQLPKTKVRFLVGDKVQTQVVNATDDKVIREIPLNKNSMSKYYSFTLKKLYL